VVNTQGIGVGIPIAKLPNGNIRPEEKNMLGWMIAFALISAVGALSSLAGGTAASMKIASLLFASLFFLGLLTYAIRGRAR
jgi:hypothetical protein